MEAYIFFIPFTLLLGLVILWSLIWSIKSGQYDDLESVSHRFLHQEETDNQIEKK
jgi:cbb3-type cytochrome oxidase maturation protein